MKQKIFVAVLVLMLATVCLVACSNTQNYDGLTKVVFNLDPGTEVIDGQTSATILAQWTWAGNVTFEPQTGYTFVYDYANGYWKSNNQGVNSSKATLEFAVSEGKAVVSFDYYCESEAETKWDYMTVCTARPGRLSLPAEKRVIGTGRL